MGRLGGLWGSLEAVTGALERSWTVSSSSSSPASSASSKWNAFAVSNGMTVLKTKSVMCAMVLKTKSMISATGPQSSPTESVKRIGLTRRLCPLAAGQSKWGIHSVLGGLWGLLGASWEPLEGVLGASRRRLEPSWTPSTSTSVFSVCMLLPVVLDCLLIFAGCCLRLCFLIVLACCLIAAVCFFPCCLIAACLLA